MTPTVRALTFLFLLAPLSAQTVDTIGGTTTTAANRPAAGKGSVFKVDSSVLLFTYEMWLDAPAGPQTVNFFIYRHHSRSGPFTLTHQFPVTFTGGVGPAWVSSGPIVVPLVCGNYYMLGVSWSGTLTYFYNTNPTALPVSFGTWERAHTLTNPIPTTYNVSTGIDIAVYRQQLTTFALPAVGCVGTGCNPASATLPRLVADTILRVGGQANFEIVSDLASVPAIYAIGFGATMPAPVTLFGCPVWMNLGGIASTPLVITSPAGLGTMTLAVPQNPIYLGTQLSMQGGLLSSAIGTTNALDVTVN